jgi:hypothetical protein
VSSSNSKKLIGGAAAAAAIGLLITPAPAQALPPAPLAPPDCYREAAGYQFAGGEVIIHYPETDAETKFSAPRGITVDAPAETFYENGTSLKGRVSGTIDKGGNWINLTVTRGSKYSPLLLTGAVLPNNTPAGNFTYENHDMQAWDSPTKLVCIPGAPVEDRPIPAPAPAPAPAPEPVAAPAPANTAPTEAQAPPPQEAAAPPPEPGDPCIPDPFDLNFPGAC